MIRQRRGAARSDAGSRSPASTPAVDPRVSRRGASGPRSRDHSVTSTLARHKVERRHRSESACAPDRPCTPVRASWRPIRPESPRFSLPARSWWRAVSGPTRTAPASVSSKSLISKIGVPSGVAKVPKLCRWQSPQACTQRPLAGVCEVGRHDAGGAAQERRGRGAHAIVTDRQQMRDVLPQTLNQSRYRVRTIGWFVPGRVAAAGTFFLNARPDAWRSLAGRWRSCGDRSGGISTPVWIPGVSQARNEFKQPRFTESKFGNRNVARNRIAATIRPADDVVGHDADRALICVGPPTGPGLDDVEEAKQTRTRRLPRTLKLAPTSPRSVIHWPANSSMTIQPGVASLRGSRGWPRRR